MFERKWNFGARLFFDNDLQRYEIAIYVGIVIAVIALNLFSLYARKKKGS
jgi:hypothetical protein